MSDAIPVQPATYPRPAESAWANQDGAVALAATSATVTATVDSQSSAVAFTGKNIVSFTTDAFSGLAEAGKVTATLTLSGDETHEYFTQEKVINLDKGATSVSGEFIVEHPGTYTVTLSGDVTGSGVAPAISADATYNNLWLDGVATFNQTPDLDGTFYFDETGSAVDLKVEKLVDYKYQEVSSSDYEVIWYKDANNNNTLDVLADERLKSAPKDAGTYFVTIWPAGELEEGFFAPVSTPLSYTVEIVDDAEQTFSLYEKGADQYDTSDTTFVYDGTDLFDSVANNSDSGAADYYVNDRIGLLVNGKIENLKVRAAASNNAYIEVGDYYIDAVDSENSGYIGNTEIKAAKTYTLKICQKTSTYGNSVVAYLKMTVSPFDVSKATVVAHDVELTSEGTPQTSTFDLTYEGVTMTATFGNDGKIDSLVKKDTANNLLDTSADTNLQDDELELSVTSFEKGQDSAVKTGQQTFFDFWGKYGVSIDHVSGYYPATNDSIVFTGDALTSEVRVAKALAEGFMYGDQDLSSDNTVDIDLKKNESFDAKEISWGVDADNSSSIEDSERVSFKGNNATVKVYDASGAEVSAPSKAGQYKVVVTVANDRAYSFAGTYSFDLNVEGMSTSDITYVVDDKVVSTATSVEYDGEPVDLSVVVRDTASEKLLSAGTDYTIEVRDLDANEVISEIVDPGEYRVTVKSGAYTVSGATQLDITVTGGQYAGIEVEQATFGYDETDYAVKNAGLESTGIAWTGSEIAPMLKAYVEKVVNGEKVKAYTELDPSTYEIVSILKDGKKASAIKDEGSYVIGIDLTDEFYAQFGTGANIAGTGSIAFDVVKTVGFSDVKASEWYADEATKAKQLGYMTGLSGTSMLMPNADITRADVAMVLMRMAGGNPSMDGEDTKYDSIFSDVTADAYYAKAINWAYKAGIITGYDGTDKFGPNDLVTREQLATMLGRFAENVMGETVSAGEIDGYADAASVQEFAVEGMSWCVENGIFGVNTDTLDPQGNATRAQVAAISVRVMPAEEL